MKPDPLWLDGVLAVHVASGGICLLAAPVALAMTKGSPRHRRWGRIYFWSMMAVAATALTAALYRPIPFLALLAVLSFYLAFSGYRVLSLKALARGGSAGAFDWLAALAAFAASATLAATGMAHTGVERGPITIVLGAAGMLASGADLRRFLRRPADPAFWVRVHLQKFLASYVAILTAFSAVVLGEFLPGLVVWLWPIALGLPVIAAATWYFRRRAADRIEQTSG